MKYTYEIKKEVVKRYLEDKQEGKKIFTDLGLDITKYTYTWAKMVSHNNGNYEILQSGKIITNKNNEDKNLAKIKVLECENKDLRKENQNLKVNNEFIKKRIRSWLKPDKNKE